MRRYKIAEKVGKRIRIIRRRKRMSQEAVAAKIGVHVSTLGRVERGVSNIPLQTLYKISLALGAKLKDLV